MRCAMVLAAGLGLRMRPLTEHTAKPLLPLGGQTLLDHALDRLEAAGVERVVINTHWQKDRVEAHLARRKAGAEIILRPEPALARHWRCGSGPRWPTACWGMSRSSW